jgi:2-haloalkanoic acid dehalogenase type II
MTGDVGLASATPSVVDRPGAQPSWRPAAVFFDFVGTLINDRSLRANHLQQLRFVADSIAADATDQELRAAYRRGMAESYGVVCVLPAYQHRTLFAGAFTAMAGALGGHIDESVAQVAVDRQYRATIEHATARPDAIGTLGVLRQASVHVQIVSNIDDEQLHPLIHRLGLDDVIDAATSSEEARSCKPDPGIYRVALAKVGCRPADALFVGDSLHHDVEGPSAVGMRTAWLAQDGAHPGPGEARPDFIVHQLAEVTGLVDVGAGR